MINENGIPDIQEFLKNLSISDRDALYTAFFISLGFKTITSLEKDWTEFVQRIIEEKYEKESTSCSGLSEE